MRSRKKATRPNEASKSGNNTNALDQRICYEGEGVAHLLKLIKSEIQLARNLDSTLPEKVWIKHQFSVGVNEVTRVLERMRPAPESKCSSHGELVASTQNNKEQLQAILLAADCNPRWLTKHLPDLAHSRQVPIIFFKDKRGSSLRLGELLKLKTAIAIGVKDRGNKINQLIEKVVISKEIQVDIPESMDQPLA